MTTQTIDTNDPRLAEGVWIVGPDGSLIPDYDSTFPAINEGEVVHGVVVRVDDVTEKARIEQTLVQSEKMLSLGGLAAGMAVCLVAAVGYAWARSGTAFDVRFVSLLVTLVLLFGFQGKQILDQPVVIALIAVPILIQVYFNAGLAYLLNRVLGEQHCIAGPSALIGASNFFELAVATAISLFGLHSGAALATVVGVLIEVPVMLSVVKIVNNSKGWYERSTALKSKRETA